MYFDSWSPYPFMYLKREKITPCGRSLLVEAIIGRAPPRPKIIHGVLGTRKKNVIQSITVDDNQNGSEIFRIAMPVRKVNLNSRGSETYCWKKKNGICLWLHGKWCQRLTWYKTLPITVSLVDLTGYLNQYQYQYLDFFWLVECLLIIS